MSKFIDYYKILDVETNATQDEIKTSYRHLAIKYHPDRGGDTKKMSQINEAYSILSNDNLRFNYDEIHDRFYNTSSHHTEDYIDKTNELIALLIIAKKAARQAALKGLVYLVIGTAITVGGYLASSNGGHYLIAWGAILFGGYSFIRGLHYYFNPNLLLKKSMGPEKYNNYFGSENLRTSYWGIVISVVIVLVLLGIIGSVTGASGSSTNGSSTSASSGGSRSLTSDQQSLSDEANRLKSEYDTCTTDLSNLKSKVDELNSQLNAYDAAGNTYGYNSVIPEQNSAVNTFNQKREQCLSAQSAANDAVDAYNKSISP